MVLPLIDEDKPKCFICYESFNDIEKLRIHQKKAHKKFFENHETSLKSEPSPGDVTVF